MPNAGQEANGIKSLSAYLEAIEKNISSPGETSEQTELTQLEAQHIQDLESDRKLKKSYARWFVYILVGQLLVMNFVFLGTGLGWFAYNEWTLDLYMAGTLTEVFGIVWIITKNLFPVKKQ